METHEEFSARAFKKLRGATATSIRPHDGGTAVRYHTTDVVIVYPNGTARLDSGGWETVTTKRRMNQVSTAFNLGFQVYQRKHVWYVSSVAGEHEFSDGMIVPTAPQAWDGETWRVMS